MLPHNSGTSKGNRIKQPAFRFLFGPGSFDASADVLVFAQFLLPLTQFLNLGIPVNLETSLRSFSSLSAFLYLSLFTLRGESLANQFDRLLVLNELSLLLKLMSDLSLNEVV